MVRFVQTFLMALVTLLMFAAGAESAGDAAPEASEAKSPAALPPEASEWDVNQNGVLEPSEKARLRRTLVERWDADADGRLSPPERKAAREAGDMPSHSQARVRASAARQRALLQQAREAQRAKVDTDGDGELSSKEVADALEGPGAKRAERQRLKMLELYDEDGDGVLNEEERKAARRHGGSLTAEEIDGALERAAADAAAGEAESSTGEQ